MSVQYFEGVGRRKESTARVRVMSGSGNIVVNEKPIDDFFTRLGDKELIESVLKILGAESRKFDVSVKVMGGGVSGQTGAVVLGLARALVKYDTTLTPLLRKGGFLTRDPRVKERKKPGLKRARKAPTYTKR
jgi:small subunit ribosomal protein S9